MIGFDPQDLLVAFRFAGRIRDQGRQQHPGIHILRLIDQQGAERPFGGSEFP